MRVADLDILAVVIGLVLLFFDHRVAVAGGSAAIGAVEARREE